jgi:hypothetical protein
MSKSYVDLNKIPYTRYSVELDSGESKVIPYFRYVNSEGAEIDLTQPPFIGELSNDLIGFKWTAVTQGQAVQKIVKFEKNMIEKKFHVLISYDKDTDYYGNLEKFLQITDKDINNLKMGRLFVGEYYLECYITANKKPKRYIGTNKTLIQLTAVCERGNWQSEHTFKFRPKGREGNEGYTGNGINYKVENGVIVGYEYPYDYAAPFTREELVNESYMDTDFELKIYGATNTPSVTIGGNEYTFLDLPLLNNEYIIVNSKDKTCIKHKQNGEDENIFRYRATEFDIYEKIKGGHNTVVVADENASVDITLFYERSEPKWSNEIWLT